MAEPTYEIVFRGKLTRDADPVRVRERLIALFRSDAARIDALLGASKATLKRGLSKAQAAQMQEVLREAGLVVAMVSEAALASVASSSPPPAQVVAVAEATPLESKADAAAAKEWRQLGERDDALLQSQSSVIQFEIVTRLADAIMLPAGALLAEAVYVAPPVIPDSNLTLADAGEVIVHYVAPAKPEIPDSHLSMAEPGEELDQAPRVELVELPYMDLTLAEPGEVILAPVQRPEPRYFDLSDMALEPIEAPDEVMPSALALALLADNEGLHLS